MENGNSNLFQQEHAIIHGRNIWHWLLTTPIGDFHIVQYEEKGMEIVEKISPGSNELAEKQFKKYCNKVLKMFD